MNWVIPALAFYVHLGKNRLHTFAKLDRRISRAVKSLENRGYLKVDWETSQASWTGKLFN